MSHRPDDESIHNDITEHLKNFGVGFLITGGSVLLVLMGVYLPVMLLSICGTLGFLLLSYVMGHEIRRTIRSNKKR